MALGLNDKLVFREVLFTVHRPVADVYRLMLNMPPEDVLKGCRGVTGVAKSRMMRGTDFLQPGSRRLLHMTDENTIVEEMVEVRAGEYMSYKIWNSSILADKFLEYATNQFWLVNQQSSTMVRWRHAFKLRAGQVPGMWGPFGRLYFKWTYVDTTYARFMDQTKETIKQYIEARR
jgi:hypothetical protein